jgi:hypothetical protein
MFHYSPFDGDISDWKPYQVNDIEMVFVGSKTPIPYWARYRNLQERKTAIFAYQLEKELIKKLNTDKVIKI